MKTLKIIATTMLLGSLTLGVSATIDQQITAIQNAAPEDRVELVNEFKTTMSTLTQQERMEATSKLRETMQGSGAKMQMQTRTRTKDADQTGEMIMNQKMHQNQAASKNMKQSQMGGGSQTGMGGNGMGGNKMNGKK